MPNVAENPDAETFLENPDVDGQKVKFNLSRCTSYRHMGEREVDFHLFLTSSLGDN